MQRVRVAICDENEVFRVGAVTCLREEEFIEVAFDESTAEFVDAPVDVWVVSVENLRSLTIPTVPIVVLVGTDQSRPKLPSEQIVAWLDRQNLTPSQLVGAVLAAGAGLSVGTTNAEMPVLKSRNRDVLRLIAAGAGTREISEKLGYSERTIKNAVAEVTLRLGARNRSQAVAEAVRNNLI